MKRLITIMLFALYLFSNPIAFADLPEAVTTNREMVVTANPLATAAAEKILKQGGTAADAMIAAQTVLGLVEPQSSGLGGGAFVVYYDAKKRKTITVDAREKAPASAQGDRFLDEEGNSIGFVTGWQSGLSVGVPGTPRMMEFMHDKYGRLPLRKSLKPAIKLAEKGFPLTARTSDQVAGLLGGDPLNCGGGLFFQDPTAFAYFANPDCTAKPAGTVIVNQLYADTLKKFRRKGADAFYKGTIAESIAAAVQNDPRIPGDMTVEDLANYDIVVREPVCLDYRGHNVCGMGPPSSGALAVGQILGILENFELTGNPLDLRNVHLFAQAGRLAFADRNLYVGDPDFVDVPVAGMLDEAYLSSRAALIDENMDMGTAEAGVPPEVVAKLAPDVSQFEFGTSHVSIVDRYGNALSMTTTIESSFGNGVMVHGFLLNNELTDFSFDEVDATGVLIANRVEANKRPRSSMSPTIVFDGDGRVEIVTGSPGGSRIIGYTAQSIMNMIDFGLDPQQAINVPHYMNRNGRTDLEIPIPDVTEDYDAVTLADALKNIGHSDPTVPLAERSVGIIEQTSGLSIIQVLRLNDSGHRKSKGHHKHHHHGWYKRTVLVGGADKRRDGTVGGR